MNLLEQLVLSIKRELTRNLLFDLKMANAPGINRWRCRFSLVNELDVLTLLVPLIKF
jgi:hypothetical protein